jgi:hypothetical protein
MEKQQLLSLLQAELRAGTVNQEEIRALIGQSSSNIEKQSLDGDSSSHKVVNILYTIGAIIAIVGIVILLAQNWMEIGFAGRVLSTLGIALATYIIGFITRASHQSHLSQIMFFISAVIAPIGSFVLLDEAGVDMSLSVNLALALILTIIYTVAYFATRRHILVLVSVGYATWTYFALLLKMFSFGDVPAEILKWATLIAGVAYILIARGYESKESSSQGRSVSGVLYAAGTLAVLGAGISFGGAFDIIFIALLFAGFYGSIFFKSRGMLLLSALFLMIHIGKLTAEYFADSIGWPVALIFIGFVVIAVGYGTLWLNRKFIKAA